MNSDAGYWIEEDVLSAAECDQLTETLLQGSVLRSPAGARHLMGNPAVATLAKDDGLLRVAKSVLGEGTVPFRATLFEKSGHANWMVVWHQDTALPLESRFDSPGWGPWSTKAGIFYAHAPAWALSRVLALRIHLDPSTSDNGPLRVIPGSHTLGVLTDEEVFSLAKAQSFAECLAGRGRCVRF
jgi:ectoine hydroxylase-related dioxygenase (phytanoyl-CoA dioxygenase family)